jgi:hypothetical protein
VGSCFPPSDPGKESCREEGVVGVLMLLLQFHFVASIFLPPCWVQRNPCSCCRYACFNSYPLFLRDFASGGGIHNWRRSSSRRWCGGEAESGCLSICGPYNQKLHCTLCSCFGFYGSSWTCSHCSQFNEELVPKLFSHGRLASFLFVEYYTHSYRLHSVRSLMCMSQNFVSLVPWWSC